MHSYDKIFDSLANVQRRELLLALLDDARRDESPTDLGATAGVASSDDADSIELRHMHLPKLDDYGFVEWDPSEDRVERGPQFDEIEPLLELLLTHDELPLDGLTRRH